MSVSRIMILHLSFLLLPAVSLGATESPSSSGAGAVVFKPSAGIAFGATSNATLLSAPTPGTYGRVTPSITAEFTPSDSFFVTSSIEASFKRFSDSTVDLLANGSGASARAETAWSLDDVWEIGGNLSLGYLQGHIPVVNGTGLSAIPQQYYEPEARIYGAWLGDFWSFELGTSGTTRQYDTVTYDIQGNSYRNTYSEIGVDGKAGYRWSRNLKAQLKSSLARRFYRERMAEFSDGLPVFIGATHPALVTLVQDNELQIKSKVASVSLTPTLGVRFEKDLIYGARDSVQLKMRGKAAIPLSGGLVLEPEAAFSRQAFSTFRADPVSNSRSSALRVDWEGRLVGALRYPVSKVVAAHAQYSASRKASNYSAENYVEQAVEAGMSVHF